MHAPLSKKAHSVLEKSFSVTDLDVTWDRPREANFGDLSTSIALGLAKKLGKKPREIADVLAEGLRADASVEKVEVAGPGYVNVWLTPAALLKELSHTRQACVAKVAKKTGKPVIVEYSQPNIAKPLGVHHLLTTVIGQAISNIQEHTGDTVIRWNYIGDWGTQFGKLAVAMQLWGGKKPTSEYTLDELLDLYVKFHDEVEKDASLEEKGRDAFRRLEQGDKELRAFWNDVVTITKASLAGIYERLHVRFDLDLGESFYEDKMAPVLEEGKKKKVFTEGKEGALIVEFPNEKYPPYLVVKGDGATLYSTRDLAQMRYRMDTYHPKAIYIVTDVAQQLHFNQLVETCQMLGWKLPEFENVLTGRMRFADKSMSTRKGNILRLKEVLEEAVSRAEKIIEERGDSIQTDDPKDLADMIGIGAVAYGILSQNRKMDMVFDWDKMLSFEGNSAPYLQYTHARARSVLRKAEDAPSAKDPKIAELSGTERLLIRTLLLLPSVLEDARDNRMPHKLANYLYQLCQDFNAFYNVDPILKAEGPARAFRLSLTSLTADVLKTGAELLTLRVPERM